MLRFSFIVLFSWTLSFPLHAQLYAPEIKVESVDQAEVRSNGDWQLKFQNEKEPTNIWMMGSSDFDWRTPPNNELPWFAISTGGKTSPKFAINRNGEIAIGTSDFDGTLKVAKRIGGNTAIFAGSSVWSHFSNGSREDTYIRGGNGGSRVFLGDNGNQRVVIGHDNRASDFNSLVVKGGAYCYTGTWTGSDKKLKKNIKKLDKGLDVIKKINTISYDYVVDVESDNSQQVGVIALGFPHQN